MEKKKIKIAKRNFNLAIICFHILIFAGLYLLFPRLLNYPSHFDSISFQTETIGTPLIVYFVIVGILVYGVEKIIQHSLHKNINKLIKTKEERTNDYKRLVIKAREDCMNSSYKFMMFQFTITAIFAVISILFIFVFGKFMISNFDKLQISIIRMALIIIAFWLLLSVFEYFALQNYANIVIKESYNNNQYYKKPDKNNSNMVSVLIQIIPILVTIFVISICFSYSNTVDVTSKAISTYYQVHLDNLEFDKNDLSSFTLMQNLKNNISLMNDNDVLFVIDKDNNVTTATGENLTKFMLTYKDKYFTYHTDENGKEVIDFTKDSNVIYESYGIDEHAFIKRIKDKYGQDVFVGVKYFAGNIESFEFLSVISVIMFAVYTVILMYWAKNNSDTIKKVKENMQGILSEKDIMKKNFMPILSNDEVGNISYYYNKIQDKIIVQNDIMFKQEQLSVLGELAGRNGSRYKYTDFFNKYFNNDAKKLF